MENSKLKGNLRTNVCSMAFKLEFSVRIDSVMGQRTTWRFLHRHCTRQVTQLLHTPRGGHLRLCRIAFSLADNSHPIMTTENAMAEAIAQKDCDRLYRPDQRHPHFTAVDQDDRTDLSARALEELPSVQRRAGGSTLNGEETWVAFDIERLEEQEHVSTLLVSLGLLDRLMEGIETTRTRGHEDESFCAQRGAPSVKKQALSTSSFWVCVRSGHS